MELDSPREIAVRVEKVVFTAETLLLWTFGPNVDDKSLDRTISIEPYQ